jgi:hypothetical protein
MKRFLVPVLALAATLLACAQPARAQFSRIMNVTLQNGDSTVAAYFSDPFAIKVGAGCTWSVSNTIATLTCGGGSSPASPSGSLQFNNSGSLGAVPYVSAGGGDCDGDGDPCAMTFDPGMGNFGYLVYGNDSSAPMGNSFDMYYSGGWQLDAYDGTNNGSVTVGYDTGQTGIQMGGTLGASGLKIESINRLVAIGRLQYSGTYVTPSVPSNFTLGAGWGSTAAATAVSGSDNNWFILITTGGAGIAANPTVQYTYADGDFTTGASVVYYVCNQSGGNDILADVTTSDRQQTNETFIWHGTPTTGKTYEITCNGAPTN